MLFDSYEQKGFLFNMNFKAQEGGYAAYRGDLVLGLGEVGDAHGHRHRKPPTGKIETAYKALADHKPKGDRVALTEAMRRTVELKRAGRGPV